MKLAFDSDCGINIASKSAAPIIAPKVSDFEEMLAFIYGEFQDAWLAQQKEISA